VSSYTMRPHILALPIEHCTAAAGFSARLNIMRQRGRKSSAELVFPVIEHRPRITPPSSLTKAERSLFTELAASAEHLRPTDAPLLASYVQATIASRRSARDPSKVDVWEKATRLQMSLATAADGAVAHRYANGRTAGAAGTASMVKLKPLEQRKAEFFAAMKRFNQLGTLVPKESLDAADVATSLPLGP
jgi:hypothetical protein